jgi:hypothetical protein
MVVRIEYTGKVAGDQLRFTHQVGNSGDRTTGSEASEADRLPTARAAGAGNATAGRICTAEMKLQIVPKGVVRPTGGPKRTVCITGEIMFRTRRDFLAASSGIAALYPLVGRCASTWEDRNPPEWTPEDIQIILNRSAWTREVTLEVTPSAAAPGQPAKRPQGHGVPIDFKALVRWESGLPVRLARRADPRSDKAGGQYQLSINRLPLAFIEQTSGSGMVHPDQGASVMTPEIAAQIAQNSTLERTGKNAIRANHAEWVEAEFSPRVVIFFPLGKDPIQAEDREVSLVSQVGALGVRARFLLKDMVYRGKLEL